MCDMEPSERDNIDWGTKLASGHQLSDNLKSWPETLLMNVHVGLPQPLSDGAKCTLASGECFYFHYGCDGHDDRGWGCGYRTVQTLCSWLCRSWSPPKGSCRSPPSLPDIQQALVTMGDKPDTFSGSREWIGTFEASLILDYFYDVACRIVHVPGGLSQLEEAAQDLHKHFSTHGSPVMMGGDRDNSSKGVLGVCTGTQGSYLLVMDPHYYGPPLDIETVQKRGWVSWKKVSSLDRSSFYNLCLPQTAQK